MSRHTKRLVRSKLTKGGKRDRLIYTDRKIDRQTDTGEKKDRLTD